MIEILGIIPHTDRSTDILQFCTLLGLVSIDSIDCFFFWSILNLTHTHTNKPHVPIDRTLTECVNEKKKQGIDFVE